MRNDLPFPGFGQAARQAVSRGATRNQAQNPPLQLASNYVMREKQFGLYANKTFAAMLSLLLSFRQPVCRQSGATRGRVFG